MRDLTPRSRLESAQFYGGKTPIGSSVQNPTEWEGLLFPNIHRLPEFQPHRQQIPQRNRSFQTCKPQSVPPIRPFQTYKPHPGRAGSPLQTCKAPSAPAGSPLQTCNASSAPADSPLQTCKRHPAGGVLYLWL